MPDAVLRWVGRAATVAADTSCRPLGSAAKAVDDVPMPARPIEQTSGQATEARLRKLRRWHGRLLGECGQSEPLGALDGMS